MADIKFSCPHCKVHIECPEEFKGQVVHCPECNRMVEIKGVVQTPPPVVDITPKKTIVSSSKESFKKPIICGILDICSYLSFFAALIGVCSLVKSLACNEAALGVVSLCVVVGSLVFGLIYYGASEYLHRQMEYAHDTLEATERIAQLLKKQKN